jgi:uncharacterized protein YqjF (DUF2071 family)
MFQNWRDLLFLHWQFPPETIQATLPPGLTVDTFAGRAYVGLVPFFMRDIRPIYAPTVPGISNFLEVNVRTYVYDENGVSGVWFYSLDANQWLAVQLARAFFKLPYFYAGMSAHHQNGISYTSHRRGAPENSRSYFYYRGVGDRFLAEPGTLEFFLAERYILFAYDGERLGTGQVYHEPYELMAAEVPAFDTHLLTLANLTPAQRQPDHILYSPGVDVDVFPLRKQ